MCKRLINEVLDPEKKIESFVVEAVEEFAKSIDSTEGAEAVKLDLLLLYLRRVHSFCFYCGEEYEDERMLATKCGP